MDGPVAGHKSFLLEEEKTLICGKLLLDDESIPLISGSSDLIAYHQSFQKIQRMRLKRFAPAFGHVIEDPKNAISTVIQSFDKTDQAIMRALKKGAKTTAEIAIASVSKGSEPEEIESLAETFEVHLAKLADEKSVKLLKAGWAIR
jgi:glyoxylase-like metal-dependent hydrolase (beta-lactamase superfamily II)